MPAQTNVIAKERSALSDAATVAIPSIQKIASARNKMRVIPIVFQKWSDYVGWLLKFTMVNAAKH
jgi:hypothetical protein